MTDPTKLSSAPPGVTATGGTLSLPGSLDAALLEVVRLRRELTTQREGAEISEAKLTAKYENMRQMVLRGREERAALNGIARREALLRSKYEKLQEERAALSGIAQREALLRARYEKLQEERAALNGIAQREALLRARYEKLQEERDELRGVQQREALLRSKYEKLQEERAALGGVAQREALLRARYEKLQDERSRSRGERAALKAEGAAAAARASLLDALAEGKPLAESALEAIRAMRGPHNRIVARAFAQSLYEGGLLEGEHSDLGRVACGVFFFLDGFAEASLAWFRSAEGESVVRLAPAEYFGALMEEDAAKGAKLLSGHLDREGEALERSTRADLLNLFAKHLMLDGLHRRAGRLLALEADRPQLDANRRKQLGWLHAMTEPAGEGPAAGTGAVRLAVMDTKMPDLARCSANLGDPMQTLGALAALCRHEGVTFAGGSALAATLEGFRRRVPERRRIAGPEVEVVPVAINRDFASGAVPGEPVWLIASGSFMKRSFGGRRDFPFPETVKPIFLSLHVGDPDMLTPEAVAAFRHAEPIGCRDWTTVYRLRDHGVAAFFSGCLTTTLGSLVETSPPGGEAEARVAVIDVELADEEHPGLSRESFSQTDPAMRERPLAENLEAAWTLLADCAGTGRVATSGLSSYLACRALGAKVDFRPKNPADIRLEGLLDLSDNAFEAMGRGLEGKIEAVLELILAGAGEDEVRTRWREICAADVAAADSYCTAYPPLPPPSFDVGKLVREVLAGALERNAASAGEDAAQVAFALDQGLADKLPAVLHSLAANTRSPVAVHLLTRGLGPEYLDRLAVAFPQTRFTQYDFGGVDYGPDLKLLAHTTVSTIDRLLLPELLPGVDRIVYLDVDLIVAGDIRELFELQLDGRRLAGKFTRNEQWGTGERLVTRASLALPAAEAWELRRRAHAEGSLDFPTFNAGVTVLDLKRMREEDFTRRSIPLVEKFAFNDQDALNLYARDEVRELDLRWNAVANQDFCEEPAILHWAGPVKPWSRLYVAGRKRFEDHAALAAAKGF